MEGLKSIWRENILIDDCYKNFWKKKKEMERSIVQSAQKHLGLFLNRLRTEQSKNLCGSFVLQTCRSVHLLWHGKVMNLYQLLLRHQFEHRLKFKLFLSEWCGGKWCPLFFLVAVFQNKRNAMTMRILLDGVNCYVTIIVVGIYLE